MAALTIGTRNGIGACFALVTSRLRELRAEVVYCQWQCTRLQTLTMTQPPGSHRPLHWLHLTENKVPHTRSCVGIGHSQRELW